MDVTFDLWAIIDNWDNFCFVYMLPDNNLIIDMKFFFFFLNTIFVSSHMYPENPEGTQVIVGSMNMGYMLFISIDSPEKNYVYCL